MSYSLSKHINKLIGLRIAEALSQVLDATEESLKCTVKIEAAPVRKYTAASVRLGKHHSITQLPGSLGNGVFTVLHGSGNIIGWTDGRGWYDRDWASGYCLAHTHDLRCLRAL